jgi:tRNA-dihydrouridine synthase
MNNDGSLKEGPKLDVLPKNNPFQKVIPQVLCCNTQDFLLMSNYLKSLGYEELNWNLGCPYPMVANRGMGSGMLTSPELLIETLHEVSEKSGMKIGLKMRMGYEDTSSILELLPQLNAFDLTEIIIHARYGKQLYTGTCDHDRFEACIPLSKHRLVYNGDITKVEVFYALKERFQNIKHWMIGRGAIANPMLFEMIKNKQTDFPENWEEKFKEFLQYLLFSYQKHSTNEGNILLKMEHYWEYFATGIPEGKWWHRKVKKLKTLKAYHDLISDFE